jgi:hypothetical protein
MIKNKNFYTAFLMGGLGNQMFQIAHTFAQGLRNGVEVKFRPFAYTPMQANQPTKYINNIFKKLNFEKITENCKQIRAAWHYEEIIPPPNTNVEFFGYYQSSKNFYGFENEIKDIFLPDDDFKTKILQKYPQLLNKNNVSIHIRRGDYLQIPDVLPTIDVSYFHKCLEIINSYDNIFVFSDDKNWVKENIKFENIIYVDGLEDYEELWTISLCRINIMSNSSFSWWGAFLNQNPNKIIYTPSIWFGENGEKDYNDIYENDWIKIITKLENKKIVCY